MTGPGRMPRVKVETRAWLPGWALRAAAAALPAVLVLLAFARSSLPADAEVLAVLLAVGLAASALWRPSHRPALVAVGLAVFCGVVGRDAGTGAVVMGLAALGYVAVRLGSWAGSVGWTTRVELAALGRSALRDGVVVAVTVLVGALGLAVRGSSAAALTLGAVALLALAWWVLRPQDDRKS
ncbi:hypothetical protein [Xylanimonas sp. McL0601]|uniref:hypothetical protein n=1 Tax=Xylanimonas sp. McL0601 TaxID=3414739 RepID=UPI003CEFE957